MRATTMLASLAAVGALWVQPVVAQTSSWLRQPSDQDLAAAYPVGASGDGWARIECKIGGDGALVGCVKVEESAPGVGFGEAALSLAAKFKASRELASARSGGVRIRLEFAKPIQSMTRGLRFQFDKRFAHLGPPGPYFPDRAARQRVFGLVTLDCRVREQDLRLTDCVVLNAGLSNFGFEDAALKMAAVGWMTADVAPAVHPPADGVWRFHVEFPTPGSSNARRASPLPVHPPDQREQRNAP